MFVISKNLRIFGTQIVVKAKRLSVLSLVSYKKKCILKINFTPSIVFIESVETESPRATTQCLVNVEYCPRLRKISAEHPTHIMGSDVDRS